MTHPAWPVRPYRREGHDPRCRCSGCEQRRNPKPLPRWWWRVERDEDGLPVRLQMMGPSRGLPTE